MTWKDINREWVKDNGQNLYDYYCEVVNDQVDKSWDWSISLYYHIIIVKLSFIHPQKGWIGEDKVILSEVVSKYKLEEFVQWKRDRKLSQLINI